jgi:hypothetical protein
MAVVLDRDQYSDIADLGLLELADIHSRNGCAINRHELVLRLRNGLGISTTDALGGVMFMEQNYLSTIAGQYSGSYIFDGRLITAADAHRYAKAASLEACKIATSGTDSDSMRT